MHSKFEDIENKFLEVERQISDPEVISDRKVYEDLLKKHASLRPGVEQYRELKKCLDEKREAESLLKDPEMASMAKQEIESLDEKIQILQEELELFLIPKDPDDHKNAIVEIRGGTGGEEAALFAADLFRMYSRYADQHKWTLEIISQNVTGKGGLKEIAFGLAGTNVFSRLKFESGTHRVQRVPDTESSGRVHTSAVTVAILPEAEEVDIQIDTKDLRIDTFRASGAGGQHVNKTDSAVRVTHIPTGVAVACQDERSQFQNKEKAMRLLRSRLYEAAQEKKNQEMSSLRKGMVGSGDRSEKIRTYNYPQSRVTDHRIGLTLQCLPEIMSGDKLDDIINALIKADRLSKLKA